jgi:hypothetical protein
VNATPAPRTRWALAAAFFAGLTVLMTWPQAARLGDRTADLYDGKYEAWSLQWDFRQTLRDPLDLFQAPIFHPARYALAFSENNYGAAVFGFPLLAAGATAYLNYNVNFLIAIFLSAFCCWLLASYVTGDPAASLLAGVVFAFLPYKMSQVSHLHMEWGGFFCLTCLFLLRYLDHGRLRDALLLALFFAWNGITCVQYGFFGGLLVAVVLLFEAWSGGPGRARRIGGAVLALGLGTLIWLPFLIPYQRASALYAMRRSIGEMTFYSGRPSSFLSAGDRNKLYGSLTRRWRGPEGDFFPGLLALGLAGLAVARLRTVGGRPAPPDVSPRRRRVARGLDGLSAVLAAAWLAALAVPRLHLGPLKVEDPGRVLVFLTLAVVARLSVAFPRRSAYRDLRDRLRRSSLDRRALLLLAVAVAGVLIALGGHTPFYRFLFQSFGFAFRAVRAVARGIVIFQLALAVLAAWGLSRWTRGRAPGDRRARIALVLALVVLEYRAFPLALDAYDPNPRPVYQWVRGAPFAGGLVEWPLGHPHDCDYTLSQGEHEKPLVNGYSGFFPREYVELVDLCRLRPIPERIWDAIAGRDGRVVVYHPHEAATSEVLAYRQLVAEGLAQGRLVLLGSALHGAARDFVFRLTGGGAPPFPSGFSDAARDEARVRLQALLDAPAAQVLPPWGVLEVPAEGATVAPDSWGMGWALDDSGIAEIRIGTELGPAGVASLGAKWPGLAEAYPDFSEAPRGGFGFAVPDLPPGPHVLSVTLVARDGGITVLRRAILVGTAPARTPEPRRSGS